MRICDLKQENLALSLFDIFGMLIETFNVDFDSNYLLFEIFGEYLEALLILSLLQLNKHSLVGLHQVITNHLIDRPKAIS